MSHGAAAVSIISHQIILWLAMYTVFVEYILCCQLLGAIKLAIFLEKQQHRLSLFRTPLRWRNDKTSPIPLLTRLAASVLSYNRFFNPAAQRRLLRRQRLTCETSYSERTNEPCNNIVRFGSSHLARVVGDYHAPECRQARRILALNHHQSN